MNHLHSIKHNQQIPVRHTIHTLTQQQLMVDFVLKASIPLFFHDTSHHIQAIRGPNKTVVIVDVNALHLYDKWQKIKMTNDASTE